jgi:hypothetical protein
VRLPNPALMLIGARIVFWATLLITFVIAEMPPEHAPQLFSWDKAEHFTAFYVLSCLSIPAYPRTSLLVIGLWLALFGATIELVQALPFINRDCDIKDWIADVIGISSSFAPPVLYQWRKFVYSPRA